MNTTKEYISAFIYADKTKNLAYILMLTYAYLTYTETCSNIKLSGKYKIYKLFV